LPIFAKVIPLKRFEILWLFDQTQPVELRAGISVVMVVVQIRRGSNIG